MPTGVGAGGGGGARVGVNGTAVMVGPTVAANGRDAIVGVLKASSFAAVGTAVGLGAMATVGGIVGVDGLVAVTATVALAVEPIAGAVEGGGWSGTKAAVDSIGDGDSISRREGGRSVVPQALSARARLGAMTRCRSCMGPLRGNLKVSGSVPPRSMAPHPGHTEGIWRRVSVRREVSG